MRSHETARDRMRSHRTAPVRARLPPDSPASQEAVSASHQAHRPTDRLASLPADARARQAPTRPSQPLGRRRGERASQEAVSAFHQAHPPVGRLAGLPRAAHAQQASQQNRPPVGRLRRQAGLPAEYARLLRGDHASQEGDWGSCPDRPMVNILRASQQTGLSRDAAFLPRDGSASRQPFEASHEGGLAARLPGPLESRPLLGCGNSLSRDASACQEGFGLPGGRPADRLFWAS